MELKIENLTKDYGTSRALEDFSFIFTEGVYGLLGPNGAGKSTLMNIITDNLAPTSGRITYDGEDIKKLGAEYLGQIGFMPQQQNLYPTFSGLRFMYYMAALKGMKKREADAQIPKLMKMVNLETHENKKLGAYSGGMKQRILIAQALLGNPKILIMDEPTSGLDPQERIRIRNIISEVSMDKTVILATHVVPDIEFISKEILLLKKGVLIGSGTPASLVKTVIPYVFEVETDREGLERYKAGYRIANIGSSASGDGKFIVRLIGDKKPEGEVLEGTRTTLEDVYLRAFED
ncbi:MAG: ATP-binding cassette domain-containing protein [Lachnospiraceae bacterium]|nr:ATP-binding cassette domain-containing protein [Lachnospiraceae bacterium]